MALLKSCGYLVEHVERFNLLGLLGWAVNGKILKADRLPVGQMGVFELIAPVTLPLEKAMTLPAGLSLIAIARPS